MSGISPRLQMRVGDRFGTLTAMEKLDIFEHPDMSTKRRMWIVKCDCGKQKRKLNYKIRKAKFCGKDCELYLKWLSKEKSK